MKKNKKPEQKSRDFEHRPFSSLTASLKLSPAAKKKAPSAPARKDRNKEESEDEAALFLRAVADGKRENPSSGHARSSGLTKQEPNVRSRADYQEEEKQLFLKAMEKIGTSMPEKTGEEELPRHHPPSNRMRQFKRGVIHIQQELDLHGQIKDEALTSLERFIMEAYSRGRQAVLVITGKGINSPEGPVLQGAVSHWLRERGKGMVAEFAPAPREMGGSGALVVFLKSRKP
jgi:DNA-nicking Smr family endonuclease